MGRQGVVGGTDWQSVLRESAVGGSRRLGYFVDGGPRLVVGAEAIRYSGELGGLQPLVRTRRATAERSSRACRCRRETRPAGRRDARPRCPAADPRRATGLTRRRRRCRSGGRPNPASLRKTPRHRSHVPHRGCSSERPARRTSTIPASRSNVSAINREPAGSCAASDSQSSGRKISRCSRHVLVRRVVIDGRSGIEAVDRPGDKISFGRMQRAAGRIDPQRPRRRARHLLPGGQGQGVIEQPADRVPVHGLCFGSAGPEQGVVSGLLAQGGSSSRQLRRTVKTAERIRLRRPVQIAQRTRGAIEMMLRPLVVLQHGLQRICRHTLGSNGASARPEQLPQIFLVVLVAFDQRLAGNRAPPR